MKKILFTIFVIFTFINVLNASNYSCEISGDDILYSNSDKYSYINVNIENIEDILSFRMYIKYDNKLFDVDKCQFLNYTTSICSLRANDKSLIFYDYNYSEDYKINDYPFFYANFKSNLNTPIEGSSKIEVYFEDVKDKNNNNIRIDKCSKIFTFENEGDKLLEEKTFDIKIKDYDFTFDKSISDYKLYVEDNINSIDIDMSCPSNYSCEISGASDLNSFGDKVLINVTTDSNEELVYTINVIREKSNYIKDDIKTEVKSIIKKSKIKIYYPYILGAFIFILIVVMIVRKKDSKKMDKYLDNL